MITPQGIAQLAANYADQLLPAKSNPPGSQWSKVARAYSKGLCRGLELSFNEEKSMNQQWLIWSIEHSQWWRANRAGYTSVREEAGRYTYFEATAIVCEGNIASGDKPDEAMVLAE